MFTKTMHTYLKQESNGKNLKEMAPQKVSVCSAHFVYRK